MHKEKMIKTKMSMEYVGQWKEGIRMKENGKMYTRKSDALWTAVQKKIWRRTAEGGSVNKLGN